VRWRRSTLLRLLPTFLTAFFTADFIGDAGRNVSPRIRELWMKNGATVFDAMRFDIEVGKNVWAGRTGTREAIHRDGYTIDPTSQEFCPHEWLDERGYIDLGLALKYPYVQEPRTVDGLMRDRT
jgi:hypothetical protein